CWCWAAPPGCGIWCGRRTGWTPKPRGDRARGRTDGMAAGGGHSPMEQFGITRLIPLQPGGLDLSFTNSAAWMLAIVVFGTALMVYGMRRRAMVPGRFQSVVELTYEFVAGMVRETVGAEGAR